MWRPAASAALLYYDERSRFIEHSIRRRACKRIRNCARKIVILPTTSRGQPQHLKAEAHSVAGRCAERLRYPAFSRSSARGTRIATTPSQPARPQRTRDDTSTPFPRHEDSHEITFVADPRDLCHDCGTCRFADRSVPEASGRTYPGSCIAQSAAHVSKYEAGTLIVSVRDGNRCTRERCCAAKRASHRRSSDVVVWGPETFVRPDARGRSFAGRSSAEWRSHGRRPLAGATGSRPTRRRNGLLTGYIHDTAPILKGAKREIRREKPVFGVAI